MSYPLEKQSEPAVVVQFSRPQNGNRGDGDKFVRFLRCYSLYFVLELTTASVFLALDIP